MSYGQLPKSLGLHNIDCREMMFYQYLPIKLSGNSNVAVEERLRCFNNIIGAICCDYVAAFGLNKFMAAYVYLTAKRMYQMPNCSFNRTGYHADGFMTDDINYIWCDAIPTVFNTSNYNITLNDEASLIEFDEQSNPENETTYEPLELLRLNQFNIHKVADIIKPCMRTFLKISFSKDKYDLAGNSHNYLLNYDWEMKERREQRNIPQSNLSEGTIKNPSNLTTGGIT